MEYIRKDIMLTAYTRIKINPKYVVDDLVKKMKKFKFNLKFVHVIRTFERNLVPRYF